VGKEKAARAFVSPSSAALRGPLCVRRLPGLPAPASGGHPNHLRIVPETHFLRIDEIRALKEELSLKASPTGRGRRSSSPRTG